MNRHREAILHWAISHWARGAGRGRDGIRFSTAQCCGTRGRLAWHPFLHTRCISLFMVTAQLHGTDTTAVEVTVDKRRYSNCLSAWLMDHGLLFAHTYTHTHTTQSFKIHIWKFCMLY